MVREQDLQDEQLTGWLHGIAHIGAAVNREVSLPELLNLIAKTACNLMSYDFCAVTLPDPTSSILLIEGSYGLSADYIQSVNATHPIRLSEDPLAAPSSRAFTSGAPVQVADTTTNPAFVPWGGVAKDQGFVSMVAVPLIASDETLGTLNCYTRSPHQFEGEEIALLTMLADQAAIVITTARLRSQQANTIADLNALNESLGEQQELHRQAEAIHERLTALTLSGGGVPAVAAALAELLARPVAVRSANGALLYSTDFGGHRLPDALLVAETTTGAGAVIEVNDPSHDPAEVEVPDPKGRNLVLRIPVLIQEEVVAWIWTMGGLAELRPLDRRAMEHAATVLALELLRARSAAEAAWRDTGEVLSGVLAGQQHRSPALLAQSGRLGHDLLQPHAVIVVRSGSRTDGPLPHRLAATFVRFAGRTTPKPLLGAYEGYVVAFWPLGAGSIENVRGVSEEIRRSLTERSREVGPPLAAVTGPVESVAGYPRAFAIARGAVELAALRGIGDRTLLLSDLGMSGLFLQLPLTSELEAYANKVLAPLRNYDLAHGTALLKTLSVLVRNDLNIGDTAEQMFVHKNTVVQRRKRIESLLGADLASVSSLTDIATALNLDEVIDAQR